MADLLIRSLLEGSVAKALERLSRLVQIRPLRSIRGEVRQPTGVPRL